MPSPHTGIGDKTESFQKMSFCIKMSASDKVQCEIRLCYLISVFFSMNCVTFSWPSSYECRRAQKTQIDSVYFYTTKMLDAALSTKQLSLALTDFTALRLYLTASWYTCQSLLATTTIAESLRGDWSLDSRWHWRGAWEWSGFTLVSLLPSEPLQFYNISGSQEDRNWRCEPWRRLNLLWSVSAK